MPTYWLSAFAGSNPAPAFITNFFKLTSYFSSLMVEICTIGGYNEVGKNSTAVKIGNEAYILDLGIHLENYIKYTQDEDIVVVNQKELMNVGAVPDVSAINDW